MMDLAAIEHVISAGRAALARAGVNADEIERRIIWLETALLQEVADFVFLQNLRDDWPCGDGADRGPMLRLDIARSASLFNAARANESPPVVAR